MAAEAKKAAYIVDGVCTGTEDGRWRAILISVTASRDSDNSRELLFKNSTFFFLKLFRTYNNIRVNVPQAGFLHPQPPLKGPPKLPTNNPPARKPENAGLF